MKKLNEKIRETWNNKDFDTLYREGFDDCALWIINNWTEAHDQQIREETIDKVLEKVKQTEGDCHFCSTKMEGYKYTNIDKVITAIESLKQKEG